MIYISSIKDTNTELAEDEAKGDDMHFQIKSGPEGCLKKSKRINAGGHGTYINISS